jgi:glycosyltransferase involved in cell wall biosynthesis
MITQALEPENPLLGFTVRWATELASRLEHLEVLTLGATTMPPESLPANLSTFSMEKERGVGRLAMTQTFFRVVGQSKSQVIFSHMVPRYTWLSAFSPKQKRQVLWYTHRKASWELRLAIRAATKIVTAVPESFPVPHAKVLAIGHGIDVDYFAPADLALAEPPLIVHVGRLMPIKNQHIILEALAKVEHLPWQMAFIGAVPEGANADYAADLKAKAIAWGLADRVQFLGGLPQAKVRQIYQQASLAINASPVGLFDKAALESMLAGLPTVTGSPSFDALYGEHRAILRAETPDDPEGLAARLAILLAMPAEQRSHIGLQLRAKAIQAHGLSHMIGRLVKVFAEAIQ